MPKADNTAALLEATARRHERTVRSAQRAIRELNAAGAEITFGGVASRAGVARPSSIPTATCGLRSRSFGRPRERTAEQESPRPRGHRETPWTSASPSR